LILLEYLYALDGLGLEAGGDIDNKYDQVREAAAAVAEIGESLMPGGVYEQQARYRQVHFHPLREVPGEGVYVVLADIARAYHLRYAPRFLLGDRSAPYRVEERCLAMVDVAQDADYGRAFVSHKAEPLSSSSHQRFKYLARYHYSKNHQHT